MTANDAAALVAAAAWVLVGLAVVHTCLAATDRSAWAAALAAVPVSAAALITVGVLA